MKTKSTLTYLFTFILFLLPVSSCEKSEIDDNPGDPVNIELTATQKSLVESDNSFSFDIFKLIMENDTESENIMISPLSISYALSMTLNGANGSTRDSMMNALRYYNLDIDDINNSYKDLTQSLMNVDERVIMEIANSVWVENRLNVKEEFINALKDYFDAEGYQFDISDPEIVDVINKWIEDHTHGKIKEMIDELSDDVVMLLVNAIYFNGKWRYKFDEDKTTDMPFYKRSNTEVMVPMMNQTTTLKVGGTEDLIIAELPYGQGNYVMDVILPQNGNSINDILPQLTSESWNTWIGNFYEKEVNIFMPRFKYEYKKSLADVLSSMGMGIAFTPGLADFSNISDQQLFISEVLHQTFIETKEEGTEAAAATVVMIELTSVEPSVLTISLDRPFLYIIRETSTNAILFFGMTGDPSV
ncbi:MAG: serpin family protein [Bacteroidales bacterium]|nr:serpin family protein [Bacteroidales bacterium]